MGVSKEKQLEEALAKANARIKELEKDLEDVKKENQALHALVEFHGASGSKSKKNSTLRGSSSGSKPGSRVKSSGSKAKEQKRVSMKQVAKKVNESIAAFDELSYIENLIKRYPDVVNYADELKNWTIAHQACLYGPFEVMVMVFNHGADMAAESVTGTTPFHYIFQHRFEDLTKVVEFLNSATRRCPVNWGLQTSKGGDTFLHRAVSGRGEGQLVPFLLQRGVPPNVVNSEGNTPLMIAIWQKQMDAVISLLAAGRTDTTIKNNAGKDAMDAAREVGSEFEKCVQPYYEKHSKSSGGNPLSLSITNATGLGRRNRTKVWTVDEAKTLSKKDKARDILERSNTQKSPRKDSRELTRESTFKKLSRSQRDRTMIDTFRKTLISDDVENDEKKVPVLQRKFVRVYLEDDVELRQLGLNDTFRSLTIDRSSTVLEVEDGIRTKMATGRTPMQVDFLKQCCNDFQLFAVYETGADDAWRCPLHEADLIWGITTQDGVRLVFSKLTRREKLSSSRRLGSRIQRTLTATGSNRLSDSRSPRGLDKPSSASTKASSKRRRHRKSNQLASLQKEPNFGTTFERLPTGKNTHLPQLVEGLLRCLKDASFRDLIPVKVPSTVKVKLKKLKQTIDRAGGVVPESLSDVKAEHLALASALLQDFLQKLPAPLIGPDIAPLMHEAQKLPNAEFKKMLLQSLLFSTKIGARLTLQSILGLFYKVSKDAQEDDLKALAGAYGPLFLRQKDRSDKSSGKIGWQGKVVLFYIQNYKYIFEADHKNIKWTHMDRDRPLLAAVSLKSLAYRLLDPHYEDDEFLPAIFMCAEYFSTSSDLLLEVLKICRKCCEIENEDWCRFVARRVCTLLLSWMECSDRSSILDKKFSLVVKDALPFLEKQLQVEEEDEDIELIRDYFVLQKKVSSTMMKSASFYQRLDQSNSPEAAVLMDFKDVSTIELAQQLMLLNHSLLSKIRVKELLKNRFSDSLLAPNFNRVTESANTYSMWTSTMALSEKTPEGRAEIISKLVDLAEQSQQMNDFHSCVCIVLGLMSPPVSRLKQTWLIVNETTLERFEVLCALASPEHNSAALRSLQQQSPLPVVPFIQLLKKDLLTAEEIPNKISKLVNVNKARVLHRIVERLQRMQEIPPLIPLNPLFRTWLQNLSKECKDEETLYALSLKLEPRVPRSTSTAQ